MLLLVCRINTIIKVAASHNPSHKIIKYPDTLFQQSHKSHDAHEAVCLPARLCRRPVLRQAANPSSAAQLPRQQHSSSSSQSHSLSHSVCVCVEERRTVPAVFSWLEPALKELPPPCGIEYPFPSLPPPE